MKVEDFNTIETTLESHLANCKLHLDNIHSKKDLEEMTCGQLVELRDFCRKEEAQMTRICMVDLYHILGMGKLTVTQQNLFLKTFKEYCSYRSDIKLLASYLSTIDNLPNLPTKSKFKLLELGDITLESQLRTGCEEDEIFDTENVNDYGKAGATLKEVELAEDELSEVDAIKIVGNQLIMPVTKVGEFLAKMNFDANYKQKIIDKSLTNGKYIGIDWYRSKDMLTIVGLLNKEMLSRIKKVNCFLIK